MKFRITKGINSFDGMSTIYRVYELRDDVANLRAGFGTEMLARDYVARQLHPSEDHKEKVVAEIEG